MRSLFGNGLGAAGAAALAPGVAASASLTALDVRSNGLGDQGEALLQQAVQGRSAFDLKM